MEEDCPQDFPPVWEIPEGENEGDPVMNEEWPAVIEAPVK
jgi:hypothetical protein